MKFSIEKWGEKKSKIEWKKIKCLNCEEEDTIIDKFGLPHYPSSNEIEENLRILSYNISSLKELLKNLRMDDYFRNRTNTNILKIEEVYDFFKKSVLK